MLKEQIMTRIFQLCEEHNWTLYELISHTDLTPGMIYQWSSNSERLPSVKSLDQICKAFGITLSEFFAFGDSEKVDCGKHELFKYIEGLSAEQIAALISVAKGFKKSNESEET